MQSAAMKANLPLFLSHIYSYANEWCSFLLIIIRAASGIYPSIILCSGRTIIENIIWNWDFDEKNVDMLKMKQKPIDHGITICVLASLCMFHPIGIRVTEELEGDERRTRRHTLAQIIEIRFLFAMFVKMLFASPIYCFKWRQTYVGMLLREILRIHRCNYAKRTRKNLLIHWDSLIRLLIERNIKKPESRDGLRAIEIHIWKRFAYWTFNFSIHF